MSSDLNHSNNMVQHILNDTIKREKDSNPRINIAHIWSDGCAGQLKNKHQLHWLTCKVGGVKISHNFFQSCHGKGPSDSEGAVVKSFLRRLAFVNNKRANSSEDAFGYCVGEEGGDLVGVQKPKQKKRHSIMSRAFYYVPVGEVDHLTRLELGSVEEIKSHFCFVGSSGSEAEL